MISDDRIDGAGPIPTDEQAEMWGEDYLWMWCSSRPKQAAAEIERLRKITQDGTQPPILECHVRPGWDPALQPLPARRAWMDNTQEKFAYRCLPLAMGNSYGWAIGSPCDFEATWDGSGAPAGVRVFAERDAYNAPVGLFGHGVLTFHVQGLFRTSPGWDLWLGPPPNEPKDAIQALSAIIETDWSPFSFTMNWKFTRPRAAVRFSKGEPIAALFPVRRGELETITPRIVREGPEHDAIFEMFDRWSQARNDHHVKMRTNPQSGSGAWQKHYYRGIDMDGKPGTETHATKLRLRPFE